MDRETIAILACSITGLDNRGFSSRCGFLKSMTLVMVRDFREGGAILGPLEIGGGAGNKESALCDCAMILNNA